MARQVAIDIETPAVNRASQPVQKQRQQNAAVSYALDIVELSKRFKRQSVRTGYTTFKSLLFSLPKRLFSSESNTQNVPITQVINDLTLRIPQGASVGVIGRNGSGKSTLLKLITGIYKPDYGRVQVNGRIAALIELGAGFHPDFTGRENLFLAGVMHGLSRAQIEQRFDTIVEFAELSGVIDDPVRTYSSGMFMRLGFSLAVHTDPDILIIDEVLAVGDEAFVHKCKEKISDLRRNGKTLILVSHDLAAVERWCDEVLWLHQGSVRDRGDPRRVIDHYRQFIEKGEELNLLVAQEQAEQALTASEAPESAEATAVSTRWGSREVEITAVHVQGANQQAQLLFHSEDELRFLIDYHVNEPVNDVVFGVAINRVDGLCVHGTNTDLERLVVPQLNSSGKVVYKISRLGLLEGEYQLDVAVHRQDGYPYDYHKSIVKFAVRNPTKYVGVWVPEHVWEFR